MFRLHLIPYNTRFDIIGKAKIFLTLSVILIIACFGIIFKNGLHYGIDFRGGYTFNVIANEGVTLQSLRNKLASQNLGEVVVQQFGKPNEYMIKVEKEKNNSRHTNLYDDDVPHKDEVKIRDILSNDVVFQKTEVIGAKVGRELIMNAIKAVLFALTAMIAYIFLRFEWRFSVCAIYALLHDCALIFGVFSMLPNMEFNEISITAILLTAAYSINDTVVIFDRIRENMKRETKGSIRDIINTSINETLSRTTLTATTTFLSVLALYMFGGNVIANFALPIMIGLIIGTFSSIFVACPLLSFFNIKAQDKAANKKPIAQI